MKNLIMIWCPELVVRTDIGHADYDHKHIATASCKAEEEGRPCKQRGVCMEARDARTGNRVTKESFGEI